MLCLRIDAGLLSAGIRVSRATQDAPTESHSQNIIVNFAGCSLLRLHRLHHIRNETSIINNALK